MQATENDTGRTQRNVALSAGKANGASEPNGEMRSMPTSEPGMPEIVQPKRAGRMSGGSNASLIRVSEAQFMTIREESLASLNLLNSSGNVLLSAMESIVPSPESGRMIGDYAGENLRRMAKSVCDIINTKCNVVRQMHSIARDE